MIYSLDTSALVDGWRIIYRPTVFGSVWNEWLMAIIDNEELIVSRSVFEELRVGGDDLYDWVKENRDGCVFEDTPEIQEYVRDIQQNWPNPQTDFTRRLTGADLFVLAHAQHNNGKVVSHEGAAGNLVDPRIRDACGYLGLECLSFIDLLEERGFSF